MKLSLWITSIVAALACDVCAALPPAVAKAAVKAAVLQGQKLVVRHGDDIIRSIDDVAQVGGPALREALEGITDVRVFAKIAKARFPAEVGERSVERLAMVADDLATLPGATDVMKLLVASNQANVKGALGELELAAILMRRKDIVVKSMREVVETGIGKTDIDVVFTYKGFPVNLERKAIDGLKLSDDLRTKIDKMSELSKTRGSVPILAAGEIPPNDALLKYAARKGVVVTYGGYLNQYRMMREALDKATALATDTLEGTICFRNTIEKGAIGDRLCHKVFGGMQHTHHRSKFKGNKGIDAVYSYVTKDGKEHLYIVENKIRGATLSDGQMSDDWIVKKLSEMQQYGDKQVLETAQLIESARAPSSAVKINKVLLEHDLKNGFVKCFEVTADGVKGASLWEKNCEPTMRGVLQEYKQRLAAVGEMDEDVVGEALLTSAP